MMVVVLMAWQRSRTADVYSTGAVCRAAACLLAVKCMNCTALKTVERVIDSMVACAVLPKKFDNCRETTFFRSEDETR